MLHQRSSEVGTYPNAIAVAPNFGMEPIMHEAIPNLSFGNETGNDVFYYNYLKEYLEEFFNYQDLITQSTTTNPNPLWFFETDEAKNIMAGVVREDISFVYLGFGFDCLNGVPILSFLALVHDQRVINDIKEGIKKKRSSYEGILFIEPDKYGVSKLKEFLIEGKYHPGAAFTISRALEYLTSKVQV